MQRTSLDQLNYCSYKKALGDKKRVLDRPKITQSDAKN
jgi:hypothetical protein